MPKLLAMVDKISTVKSGGIFPFSKLDIHLLLIPSFLAIFPFDSLFLFLNFLMLSQKYLIYSSFFIKSPPCDNTMITLCV